MAKATTKDANGQSALNDEFAAYRESVKAFFTVDQRLAKATAKVADLSSKITEARNEVERIKEEKEELATKLGLAEDTKTSNPKSTGGKPSEKRAAVADWFRENAEDWVKLTKEVKDGFGLSPLTITDEVNALIESGKLKREGKGPGTKYSWVG